MEAAITTAFNDAGVHADDDPGRARTQVDRAKDCGTFPLVRQSVRQP